MNRRGANRIGPLGSSGVIAQWGASSLIKSIQRGTGSYAAAVTISAVDVNNTVVLFGGNQFSAQNDAKQYWFERLALTNSTTLTYTMGTGAGVGTSSWQVVEFLPGVVKSIQRGTVTIPLSGPGYADATITAVNSAKSYVSFLGSSNDDPWGGYGGGHDAMPYVLLQASTTVRAYRYTSGLANCTVGFEVVEFF
jgi:hypothetical protein